MGVHVVADRARHYGDVGFGLRLLGRSKRVLDPYVESGIEHLPQACGHELNHSRMAASLGCHREQLSVNEFQLGVRLERAGFYGPVVLDPAQAVDVGRCGSHDGTSIVADHETGRLAPPHPDGADAYESRP